MLIRKPSSLYLVGPMGVGKSTIGKRLAALLGLEFYDSDHEIERRTGVDIPTIFEIEGESGFREREAKILRRLTSVPCIVLATGGGVVLSEQNRMLLRNNGFVIYLTADADRIFERISKDTKRPLLQHDDSRSTLVRIMEERDPLYTEIAAFKIDTTQCSIKQVIDKIYNFKVSI